MDGSFLDAGILDIAWFLCKVLFAIIIIWVIISIIGAAIDSDSGSVIIGIVIFLLFLYGLYLVFVFGLRFFIAEENINTTIGMLVGGVVFLWFMGWTIESLTKRSLKRNDSDDLLEKVKRGEVLDDDDFDEMADIPVSIAMKIMTKNEKNIKKKEKDHFHV